MYTVTYRTLDTTTPEQHGAIQALPTEEVDLADVIDACQTFGIDAELFDAPGFRKGWVHADGTYQLR